MGQFPDHDGAGPDDGHDRQLPAHGGHRERRAIDARAGADAQLVTDQAQATETLAVSEANSEQAVQVDEAQAQQQFDDAQASADETQSEAQATAQAKLDTSSTAAEGTYNVAAANDYASSLAASASADPTPLANYWAAVAAADATQASADATAANAYETSVTAADLAQSDAQATARYNDTVAQDAADLTAATAIAGYQATQSIDDAGYQEQEVDAEGAADETWTTSVVQGYVDVYAQVGNADESFVNAAYAAGSAALAAMGQPTQSEAAAAFAAARQSVTAALESAAVTWAQSVGATNDAEATALGDADVALADAIGSAKIDLAGQLAADANTETTNEQAADVTEAQAIDAAAETQSVADAQAAQAYTTATSAAEVTGRYTTTYDALNRDHVVVNPAGKTQTLTYDGASRRRTLVDPEGGTFTYGYDLANRCTSLVNPEGDRTSWTFDGEGRNTVQLLANGIRVSMAYDAGDRLARLAHLTSTGTTITSFRDTWDAANNRIARVEADGTLNTWTYDNTYQLTRERRDGTNAYDTTYVYDPSGNRLRKVDSGATTTYLYDVANQLSKYLDSTGTTTFTFDANGNQRAQQVPAGGITTNTWDFENRLIKVALPTGVLNTFLYNGDGQRVEIQDSSGTLKQIWDGQKVLEETDQNSVVQVIYTLSPGLYGDLVAQRRSGTTSYYLFDPLGSTVRLADGAQSVTDSYLDDSFGVQLRGSGSTANAYRFVGRAGYVWELDTTDYHLRARDLVPGIGRFSSKEPFAPRACYAYAGSNPVTLIDPSGYIPIPSSPVDVAYLPYSWDGCSWYRQRIRITSMFAGIGYLFQHVTLTVLVKRCDWCLRCEEKCIRGPKVVKRCTADFYEFLSALTPFDSVVDQHTIASQFSPNGSKRGCLFSDYTTLVVKSELRLYYGAPGYFAPIVASPPWSAAQPLDLCGISPKVQGQASKPAWWGGVVRLKYFAGMYEYTALFDCCERDQFVLIFK